MFRILLILFITLPILEIYLLIQVGEQIGLFPTLLTILFTAVLGASLVRREGIKTLHALQERVNNNETPGRELADGALLLLAGILLVTPGFFTDGIGFALAFPVSRALLRNSLMKLFITHIKVNGHNVHSGQWGPNETDESTIEGEYQHHEQKPTPSNNEKPPRPPQIE
ncbi:MAG: FxsA family protein [Magnetococcales bacterium]|nr:FxsA family protein [Magnetococcales bacterium]